MVSSFLFLSFTAYKSFSILCSFIYLKTLFFLSTLIRALCFSLYAAFLTPTKTHDWNKRSTVLFFFTALCISFACFALFWESRFVVFKTQHRRLRLRLRRNERCVKVQHKKNWESRIIALWMDGTCALMLHHEWIVHSPLFVSSSTDSWSWKFLDLLTSTRRAEVERNE